MYLFIYLSIHPSIHPRSSWMWTDFRKSMLSIHTFAVLNTHLYTHHTHHTHIYTHLCYIKYVRFLFILQVFQYQWFFWGARTSDDWVIMWKIHDVMDPVWVYMVQECDWYILGMVWKSLMNERNRICSFEIL